MKRLALVIVIAVVGNYLAAESGGLQLKQTIPLPGVEGRIDHLDLDAAGERLFVCALGNNTAEVLDLRKGERVHTISDLGAPQGLVYIAELNRLFIANDKGGVCKIYDAKSYQNVGEIDLKDDADNVRYDSATKKIYVGFGSGGIAIVNALDGKQISSIKLSAHPEAFELEKNGKRIFVNVPNSRHVAVIDREKGEVVTTWKTTLLQRSISPAIPMTFSTTASAIASTQSAALGKSTSSSRLIRIPIQPQVRSTLQTALAPDFSFPNATPCS